MTRYSCVVGFICLSVVATSAFALNQRSFVSTNGSDLNSCLPTSPCRNFAAAVAATSDGGEVIVLTSGGYGPFSISSKSISIISPPGVYAGVTASTGNAIDITLSANENVSLQGLTLNALGGANGVFVSGAPTYASVSVSRLSVTGFTQTGLMASAYAKYDISDSQFRRNGTYGVGIEITIADVWESVLATRCLFIQNGTGFAVTGPVRATVIDSIASHNSFPGFQSVGNGSYVVRLERCTSSKNGMGVYVEQGVLIVSRSTIDNNNTGARSFTGGSLLIGDTWVTGNGLGLQTAGGALLTLSNNVVESNTAANGTFTGTFVFK